MALRGLVCMLAPALADAGAPYAGTAMIAGGSGKGPLLSFKANVGNAAFKTDRQPQDLLTWNERTDPCDDRGWESFSNGWAGVMCNAAGGFVTIVDQQFGGVSGDIKELSPLVELRTLNLSENPKVRGSISSLGGLTRLQFLGLYGTSVHGEVSSLSRLRHLGEDWMAPDGTKTCVATGKRQSECQQDGITGRLFLRGTLVSGSVQPLRAIEGLGEQWGPRGGKEFAKDSYTACSAFAPSDPHHNYVSWDLLRRLLAIAACAQLGLSVVANAADTAGTDQCACCKGCAMVRNKEGRCVEGITVMFTNTHSPPKLGSYGAKDFERETKQQL